MLPGGALQLTSESPDQTGYAFIDLPFSPVYGIRASFEYFAYGGSTDPADGLSFFLFDGNFDASTFEIGGLGGSLGYAAHRYNSGTITSAGATGGYLGIGLDQRNFGNEYNGKVGSFRDPIGFLTGPAPATEQYINSISLRGPVNTNDINRDNNPDYSNPSNVTYQYDSYKFIDGKILNQSFDDYNLGATNLGYYLFSDPLDFFTIGTTKDYRVTDCYESGYRKVFIDLKPNPSTGFYDVSMWMLVTTTDGNPRIEPIFTNVSYNFPSPENLKIGFAAANGQDFSYHEISNVTVDVSTEATFPLNTYPIDEEFCEGESERELILKIPLENENSFIRCIQLYRSISDVPSAPTFSPIWPDQDPNNACAVDGICSYNYCLNGNESLEDAQGYGNFEITGIDEVDDNGNIVGEIDVKFTANPSFTSGVAQVWYTVTDNYGQISDPQPIKIIYTSLPTIIPPAPDEIVGPTCDGQSDGYITGVIVNDLLPSPNSSFQWYEGDGIDTNGEIINKVPIQGGTITGITGLNIGKYYLEVTNSNGGNGCPVIQEFEITDERGTPVVVDADDQAICEGGPVTFVPRLEDPTDGNNPIYKWYKDANKVPGSEITNNLQEGNVTYTINSLTGELTVTGLAPNTTPYIYYVEVDNPADNLCASEAGNLTPAKVTVGPGVTYLVDVTKEDWCLANGGEITVSNLGGGDGAFLLELLDENDVVLSFKNINTTSGSFSGLAKGIYAVRVTSGTPACISTSPQEEIQGPDEALSITILSQTDPTCGLENGKIEFEVAGGTSAYAINVNGLPLSDFSSTVSGNIYTLTGLAPAASYTLEVLDANSCDATVNSTALTATTVPVFEASNVDICPTETAILSPLIIDQSNSVPVFNWFFDAAFTQPITAGTVNGVTYSFSGDDLIIDGLTEDQSSYEYYLQVTGTDVCNQAPITATVNITPTPVVDAPVVTPVTCNGGTDGIITLIPSDPATASDYEYSIDAGITYQNGDAFSGLIAGTYDIQIRNKTTGCFKELTGIVVPEPAIIEVNQPDISRASCGLPNGSIDNLVITGGSSTYAIEWRRGSETGPIVPGDLTGAQDLLSGTYFAIITNAADGSCSTVFDFLVEEQPLPDYQVVPVEEECEGTPVTLTPVNIVSGSSTTEVKWYKGPGQTNEIQNGPDPVDPDVVYTIDDTDWVNPKITIDGLAPGSYTYYFYVVCTGQEIPVAVEIFAFPVVTFESSPETCFDAADGKISVASGGNASQIYFVDGSSTALTQAELENLNFAPKVYDIRVEHIGIGCPASFQVEVLGPAAPLNVEPLTQIDPGCGADIGIIRTKITGGWAPYEVTLFKDGTALNTQNITGSDYEALDLAPGDYYLSIEDAEGCIISSNTITLVYGPSQILVDDVEICEGGVAELKPSINPVAPGATFEWFKNSALTIPIVSDPNPDANGHIFEISADGTLSVSGLDNSDSPVTYYVRAVGAGVCPGFVADPTVGVFDQPTVTGVPVDEICFGEGGTITLAAAGGSGTYEYSLDGSNFQSSNVFTVASGTYTATVRSGGCENTSSDIIVTGPSTPISNSTPTTSNPTCGQSNGVIAFQISGGFENYAVETFQNGQSIGTTNLSDGNFELHNLTAGTYSFEITDGKGCIYPVADVIDLVDGLTPLEAPDQEICEGEVASITPTSTQIGISPSYTWYQNSDGTGEITSGTTAGITYQLGSDGTLSITGLPGKATPYTYYVGISGAGVCPPPLKAVDVMVYPIPNLRVSNPSIVCDPTGTVDLTEYIEGFNATIYDYQIESPTGESMRLDEIEAVDESGTYLVQSSLKGAKCWTPINRILVKIAETELIPEFNYEADQGGGNILVNAEVQILEPVDFLDASQGDVVIWNWDFGDGRNSLEQNPTHIYDTKGMFTVTLTTIDEIGCVATFQRVIEVRDDYMIIIPNAFTPTGSKNLYFKPQFRGISSMDFYVFNTWGELIFESNSLETLGWDGTWKGKATPNGNYVYKAIFTTRSGQKVEKAGVFVLIR